MRGSDTVSRQGSDEFVIVLSEVEHPRNAARLAEKIKAALSAPHAIAHHDLHVNASIGISIFPDDGQDAETLVKCADTAMYYAKDSGRNAHRFFKSEMNARMVERQTLARRPAAVPGVLRYQSKTHLETGLVTGADALRRPHLEPGALESNGCATSDR